ncbi:uncharacterized protein N7500_008505 [Penicillium coprophilum]|uniref:uncharacterized protein n=1 Tax=Penicillium coprophilum TaxID=36646 RepID=UPI00239BF532|nr:uncharacterized protein N7500_008505 [Penicillium coprophilum]KAJ5158854.1 hypothetical protein N7500_008505 [Penicillium coprophilum]
MHKDILAVPQSSDGYGAFNINKCYITDCDQRYKVGDNSTTRLNEDSSGRGCGGKNHNARNFCCPARNAPVTDTCYWTGGPKNCHGQCAAGEVGMVLDDYGDSGKRCTNGGKKVWCCPATNGQAAIQKCALTKYNKQCPSDLPQEMTTVGSWRRDLDEVGYLIEQKFCYPAKPDYDLDQCGWYGENKYCNDNECPLGEVELFRWNGWHEGLKAGYHGCNKGRRHAFCCPPPLSDGSAFLPVPLENLFPSAGSFLDSYATTFAQDFDTSADETFGDYRGNDPNINAFAWIVVVGEPEDVQSFDKRDGSHLELFDCPDTEADDFSIQKLRAAYVGGKDNEINCSDILLS